MPGSSSKGKIAIAEWYPCLPYHARVLDVGPGWGTYSKLLRRSNEVWEAVEVHEPYVERFHLRKMYDQVHVEDIRDFKPKGRYDLILMGDILEHLTEQDAVSVLKKLCASTRYCIVSLPLEAEAPVTDEAQENSNDYWKNPFEKHLARWSNKKFLQLVEDVKGEIIALEKYDDIGVYLIGCEEGCAYLNLRKPVPFKSFINKYSYALDYDPRRVSLTIRGTAGKGLAGASKLVPKKLKPGLKKMLKLDKK